jgi:hypothetical protein
MNSCKHALASAAATAVSSLCCASALAKDPPPAPLMDSAVHAGGIWKAAVPAAPMKGQFDNLDPVGVAAGARIKADCSINWINPDDGARYCFSSGTSLVYFLDAPHANIERAWAGWRKLNAQPK